MGQLAQSTARNRANASVSAAAAAAGGRGWGLGAAREISFVYCALTAGTRDSWVSLDEGFVCVVCIAWITQFSFEG